MIPDTPSTEDSEFLSIDATETYLIPLESWRQAQQSPVIGSRIGPSVVEESTIELLDR